MKETRIMDKEFKHICRDLARPSVVNDVKELLQGRVFWRKAANVLEVGARILACMSSILAFTSASELPGDQASRALAFAAGSCGTVSLAVSLLSQWGHTQTIERSNALNTIFREAGIEELPIVIQDVGGASGEA